MIAGVDEAGRGPLAGPVVAVACSLKEEISEIKDSKLLSKKKREGLYEILIKRADYGIGVVENELIDKINILNASLLAMRIAVLSLKKKPSLVLVDGPYKIPDIPYEQIPIIRGDKNELVIGAASIIAKVTRDRIMENYDKIFPFYGFAKHKGYPTREHIMAIQKYGLSKLHRITFTKHLKRE
ncbi:MAG: ribonuclease HII [bacterium]